MGLQRRAALAALLIALLCGAHTVQAGRLNKPIKWMQGKIDDAVAEAVAHGVDGMSEVVAGWAEADGEPEIAAAIRSSGDAFEAAVMVALDAAACTGFVKGGASLGGAVGCIAGPIGCVAGAVLGGVLGGLVSPACHAAADKVGDAFSSAWNAGVASAKAVRAVTCSGRSFVTDSSADCADACDGKFPDSSCYTWYFDSGCCLCKVTTCESSTSTSDTSSSSSSQNPTTDSSGSEGGSNGGSCGSLEYDVDYYGGDIVPVSTKWADTAVEASSPEDCCEACSLYSYCGAWTFTPAKNCQDRFPGAPGCCYLKKGTGYEKRSAPGMVSGTSGGPPVATCTLEFDTDYWGGDIQTGAGQDTVVPTISDADCCASCAAVPGCGAWTMAPHSECADRLPHARGCCFLKHEGGWTRTKDEKGVLTSGQLL